MQKELKSSGSETLFWVCCTPNSHECAGAPTRKIARRSSAASLEVDALGMVLVLSARVKAGNIVLSVHLGVLSLVK